MKVFNGYEGDQPVLAEVPVRYPSFAVKRTLDRLDREYREQLAELAEQFSDVDRLSRLPVDEQAKQLTPDIIRHDALYKDASAEAEGEYVLRCAQAIINTEAVKDAELRANIEGVIHTEFWDSQDPEALAGYVRSFRSATKS